MRLDSVGHHQLIQKTIRSVCERFGVSGRPVQVKLSSKAFKAHAKVNWPPDPAILTISRELIGDVSALGHEIAHCMIPTECLLFAEGFATLYEIEQSADCTEFGFPGLRLDKVLSIHSSILPSLAELIDETPASRQLFDFESSYGLEVRLSYLVSASFVSWVIDRVPEFAVIISNKEARQPREVLLEVLGESLSELECAWRESVLTQSHKAGEKNLA